MAIKYCDWATGDDTSGDGSYGNPYKTITKASTGLTGGDEVRVAKSPDPTALTGTIAFTAGSTTITGTDTLFTTELAIGDFVEGGDGYWYEVITIASDTSATLYQKYSGTTASGASSRKLGVTSTGAASSTTTDVQVVSVNGSSVANMLTISGGWDLSTETQTGQTFFRQMNGTFANRYGSGLYVNKSYINISRLHFLRYYIGIYLYTFGDSCTITSPICLSNGHSGVCIDGGEGNVITDPIVSCNSNYGLYLTNSRNNIASDVIAHSCGQYGIYMSNNDAIDTATCNYNAYGGMYISGNGNTINEPTCNNNTSQGIYFFGSCNTVITPTCNNNGTYGIYCHNGLENKIYNYQGSSVGLYDGAASPIPSMRFVRFNNTAGDNRCYYQKGVTYRDTDNARSGECLRFAPAAWYHFIAQSFYFKADSGVGQTISAYVKRGTGYGGYVQGALFFNGSQITDWTDIKPTNLNVYEQKSLVADAGDITEDGVIELKIRVHGSGGSVYVDDLATAGV